MFEAVAAALGGSVARAPWGWGILALLLTAFWRMRPQMAKLAADREVSLLQARADDNDDLKARVAALEGKLDADRAQHNAERAADRHRINNLTQCLEALLMLLETAPDKVADHVARIKQMRAQQLELETQEKTAIHQAAIAATGPKT